MRASILTSDLLVKDHAGLLSELRLPLFEKRRGPFAHLLARGANPEKGCFEQAGIVERQIESVIDRLDTMTDGERPIGKDLLQQGINNFDDLCRLAQQIDETDSLCFVGTDISAGEQNLESASATHEAW